MEATAVFPETTVKKERYSERLAVVDVLRALTMVLMIFVNDLWSLSGIPEWLEHVSATADGMGLADVVFPAFLFIVGLSLPFAINHRRKLKETNVQIAWHVIVRGFALIVMGLYFVNGEYLNEEATGMSRALWNTLICLSFILIWKKYSPETSSRLVLLLRAIGVGILVAVAFFCRGEEDGIIKTFSTYWWGILGLIGWAYLVCGLCYTFAGERLAVLAGLWALFNFCCIASHAGLVQAGSIVGDILKPLDRGAMPSLVMGGVVMSVIYLRSAKRGTQSRMLMWFVALAVVLLIAGFYTRPFWGISKIRATPSWVWICSAITMLAYVVIYWITDRNGKASWFSFIRPGGTNTLMCYLLPYFLYAANEFIGLELPELMLVSFAGIMKSIAFALLVVWIGGLFEKRRLQLKL